MTTDTQSKTDETEAMMAEFQNMMADDKTQGTTADDAAQIVAVTAESEAAPEGEIDYIGNLDNYLPIVGDGNEDDEEIDWRELLDLKTGRNDLPGAVDTSPRNAIISVMNHPAVAGAFAGDLLTGRAVIKKSIIFENEFVGDFIVEASKGGESVSDNHIHALRTVLSCRRAEGGLGVTFKKDDLEAAINLACCKSEFHPILDLIEKVEWDGVKRVDTVLIDYLDVADNPYAREVSRKFILGSITRLKEPGHKFDFVPVIEGKEGIGKSTFLNVLALGFHADLTRKDTSDANRLIEKTTSTWIIEAAEFAAFAGMDADQIKSIISPLEEIARLAYRRDVSVHPRQSMFAATVNGASYLTSPYGNRRFWPIVSRLKAFFDVKALKENVMQIWAEALHAYHEMRAEMPKSEGYLPLHLTDPEAVRMALFLQGSRMKESFNDMTVSSVIHAIMETRFMTDDKRSRALGRNEACFEIDGRRHAIEVQFCPRHVAGLMGFDRKLIKRNDAETIAEAMRQIPWISYTGLQKTFSGLGRHFASVVDTTHPEFIKEFRAYFTELEAIGAE